MYEDRTQNYDAGIHETISYMMHAFSATSFITMCRLYHSYKHN